MNIRTLAMSITRMTATALPKHGTLAQSWRKPLSRVFAVFWLTAAFLTLPYGFATGWHEASELTGFLLLITAALGRIWCLAYIAGRKNRELCQDGPYSLCRNPLYFFSFVGVVGFSLAIQNVILGAIAAVAFLLYYSAVIRGEEKRLRTLHDREFDSYHACVPRFWPRLAMPTRKESLVLNLGPFTRGLREVFLFPAAIVLADALEWVHLHQLWSVYTLPF